MKSQILAAALAFLFLSWVAFPALSYGRLPSLLDASAGITEWDEWIIKGLDADDSDGRGVVFTNRLLLATNDDGKTWRRLELPLRSSEVIAGIADDTGRMTAVIADPASSSLTLAESSDAGVTWSRRALDVDPDLIADAMTSAATLRRTRTGTMEVEFRVATSSNFEGRIRFRLNGGSLELVDRKVELRTSDEAAPLSAGRWQIVSDGSCASGKQGCVQETRLVAKGSNITPPQIEELARAQKSRLVAEAQDSPMFSLPPGGTTRISLNRGFDKCDAPTVAQMQTWWNNSPFYDVNIYMSGRNRGCRTQPNLSASWVNQVTAMGWGLIPTIVGYQSPCINSSSTTIVKHSIDPVMAESQGRGEADIAVADAANLGLTAGSILYYDMERYDETASTPGCRTATTAFLKGWTDRVKELGYKSGTYGSPKNAQEDWVNLPPASKMDAIWMARWDGIMSVWTYTSFPSFPANEWTNHQRIKQWLGPRNETWGGVTFNIDNNISDAPVAGLAIQKNKNADFDGDGKTDHSVFRPGNAGWYMLLSGNSSLRGTQFGAGTDVPAPGDFDGDGKTDIAVFRPSDGTWHMLDKAGIYSSRSFGATGDIPTPADFNGDGKTDIAVFRPSTGVWYIASSDSRGSVSAVSFGASSDKPVAADFDGDGKDDVAIWRPNGASGNAEWWLLRSSDNQVRAYGFGAATDQPVVGDHTGDGKEDVAFYRPSTGYWFVLRSEDNSYYAYPFGTAGDIAAPGDYDGDNKFDASVFRPSTGVWYVLRSTGGFSAISFGENGDKLIPAAYQPQ